MALESSPGANAFVNDLVDNLYDEGPELVETDASKESIIKALRADPEFFIEFFLPEIDLDVPQFHIDCWELMTDLEKSRVLLAIPRDHAKTTLSKLVVVWYWLFTTHRFCIYLSNTNAIAKGACKDIMDFMKCSNFVSVFGKIRIEKESEQDSLWIFRLTLPTGKDKKCILRAIGQGQQMRGINIDNQRPDIAVVDDVEDLENTGSDILQKKLDRWMYGPFIKALARKHKILWLGNMLQKTSLLARQARNPRWNPVVFGAIIEDKETGRLRPLWEDKWSMQELKDDFKEYRDLGLMESWMCEMMNMPGYGENGFRADMIHYMPRPNPDQVDAAWLTLDPAFGQKSSNDDSAITLHVLPKHGTPMSIQTVYGKLTERQIFHEMVLLAQVWDAWVWGIESIAAQRLMIPMFEIFEAGERLNHRVEYVPLMSGRGDPKAGRVKGFVNGMVEKDWALADDDIEITTQLLSYDITKSEQVDDIVDSAAYGPIMLNQFKNLIMYKRDENVEGVSGKAKHGAEVAGV